ncbi:TerB family tellurite resistance protein [Denitromonas halophila]|uniref:TerB family tellurite resistance protein n=1 Tax=Denitromonas halophila TaxID=1629404 RepID=A0A557QGA5_9RHOO|nr:TerB family tellurite resistance protein [Denitromonas halophila]TVO51920.1 TerB family tellurite resistance protein [Denitromonas halophila]
MRSYPDNSPQAAARILSLAILIDGGFDRDESRQLSESGLLATLGLDEAAFDAVLEDFCYDLQQSSTLWSVSEATTRSALIDSLLSEIVSPSMRLQLLDGMLRIVGADGHVSRSEAELLRRASARWIRGLEH